MKTWDLPSILRQESLFRAIGYIPDCLGRDLPFGFRRKITSEQVQLYTWASGALAYNDPVFQLRFRKRLSWVRFMVSTWEALRIGLQLVGRKLGYRRQIAILKDLLTYPIETAQLLKGTFSNARDLAFEKPLLQNKYNSLLKGLTPFELLQLGQTRAFPAPMYYTNESEDLVRRLQQPMTPDVEEYRQWVSSWVDEHMPPTLQTSLQLTTRSCFELRRSQGGKPKAVRAIIDYQRVIEDLNLNYTYRENQFVFSVEDNRIFSPHLCGEVLYQWRLLWAGCLNILDLIDHPPAAIISAGERGLKVRVPTKSIVPVTIVGGVLRSLADQVLLQDPRIAPSLSSIDPEQVDFPTWGFYRSLDLTTATDNHSFELGRVLYDEILKRLSPTHPAKFLTRFIPKLLGPKYLFFPKECPCFPIAFKTIGLKRNLPPELLPNENPPYLPSYTISDRKRVTHMGFVSGGMLDLSDTSILSGPLRPLFIEEKVQSTPTSREYILEIEEYYKSLRSPRLSRRGQLMGDLTSWPNLPLVSLFTWEKAAPDRKQEIRTTGDDALARPLPHQSIKWTEELKKLGCVVSERKDYYHPSLAIFTEIPFFKGVRYPIMPLAPLVCPSGGTKGEANWYTAPSSIQQSARRWGYHYDLPYLEARYYPAWRAAALSGLPIQWPSSYGGLGLEGLPHKIRMTELGIKKWGKLVSSLSPLDSTRLTLASTPAYTPPLKEILRKSFLNGADGLIDPLAEKFSDAVNEAFSTLNNTEFLRFLSAPIGLHALPSEQALDITRKLVRAAQAEQEFVNVYKELPPYHVLHSKFPRLPLVISRNRFGGITKVIPKPNSRDASYWWFSAPSYDLPFKTVSGSAGYTFGGPIDPYLDGWTYSDNTVTLDEILMRVFLIPAALLEYFSGKSIQEQVKTPTIINLTLKFFGRLNTVGGQFLRRVKSPFALIAMKDAERPVYITPYPLGLTLLGALKEGNYVPSLLGVDTFNVANVSIPTFK